MRLGSPKPSPARGCDMMIQLPAGHKHASQAVASSEGEKPMELFVRSYYVLAPFKGGEKPGAVVNEQTGISKWFTQVQ